jgi:hexosaminidase
MNALHWHLTDDESFPLCLENEKVKILCETTRYREDQVYRKADVQHIKKYASERGVVV